MYDPLRSTYPPTPALRACPEDLTWTKDQDLSTGMTFENLTLYTMSFWTVL